MSLNQNLLVVPSCFLNLSQHEGMYNKFKNHRGSSLPLFRNIKKESIPSRENFFSYTKLNLFFKEKKAYALNLCILAKLRDSYGSPI